MSSKPKNPTQGNIYFIDPKFVYLKCKDDHEHHYDISSKDSIECKEHDCYLTINSSQIMRGEHPYIVWSNFYKPPLINLYYVIPLTSQDTFNGLPTTYAIKPSKDNNLTKKGYALIHQLTTVDAACFKDINGDWIERRGKIDKDQKEDIKKRLINLLNLPSEPNDDWLKNNASPELIKKISIYLTSEELKETTEFLVDKI